MWPLRRRVAPAPEVELQWHAVSTRPRPQSAIVFEWLGTVYRARFIDSPGPWSIAWYVSFASEGIRIIMANQIQRWAYADGS